MIIDTKTATRVFLHLKLAGGREQSEILLKPRKTLQNKQTEKVVINHNTLIRFVFSFYADFGPLNLSMLYRYCCKLNKKLKVSIDLKLRCFLCLHSIEPPLPVTSVSAKKSPFRCSCPLHAVYRQART